MFHGVWCPEIHRKKVRWQNWTAANFNVRKMYSAFERMDGCESSIEITMVPLNKRIAGTNPFLEINILLLTAERITVLKQSSVKLNIVLFKEWMTVILSVTKADTLLQGMDDCN